MLLDEKFCETCTPYIQIKDAYDIESPNMYYGIKGILNKIIEFIKEYSIPAEPIHNTKYPINIANEIETDFNGIFFESISCKYTPINEGYPSEIIYFDIHIDSRPYTIRLIPKDELYYVTG